MVARLLISARPRRDGHLAAQGGEHLGIAALVSWAVTASLGLSLFGTWAARGGLGLRRAPFGRTRDLPPPYVPAPLILAHALLAVSGLFVWVAYLIVDRNALAWAALGMLMPVDLVGVSMFTRWLGSRRTRPIAPLLASETAAAETRLPVVLVMGHGLLALVTVTLVFLTTIGVGES